MMYLVAVRKTFCCRAQNEEKESQQAKETKETSWEIAQLIIHLILFHFPTCFSLSSWDPEQSQKYTFYKENAIYRKQW